MGPGVQALDVAVARRLRFVWQGGPGVDTFFFSLHMLVFISTPLGLVLAAIGGIVRLCEASWGKSAGDMGSGGLFKAAGLAFLPATIYLGLGLTTLLR